MEQATATAAFEVNGAERDSLVEHARTVIFTAADQMMTRDDEATVKRGSQHIAVMVRLLDQLGWSLEGDRASVYTLDDHLLPLVQIRVWVDRFLAEDNKAVRDYVRCHFEDLDKALRRYGSTCRLLQRLNGVVGARTPYPTENFLPEEIGNRAELVRRVANLYVKEQNGDYVRLLGLADELDNWPQIEPWAKAEVA